MAGEELPQLAKPWKLASRKAFRSSRSSPALHAHFRQNPSYLLSSWSWVGFLFGSRGHETLIKFLLGN
ncbi:hypothetical protein RchiOBHm_Chr6g0311251 [Rosa chinensis]|uniref:Uncharacterized protein n=1 Tax=Rosa chinensis TaxID=74649 RepID=A0A2P6Q1E4_ROSCH|nr:hypothetical protein RchiOBHm_Chr6g0311251 [Rosa chinensis]